MDEALLQYKTCGTLPEDINHEELNNHLLSLCFPSKSIDLDCGKVSLINISPIPIGKYGCDYRVVEAARISIGSGVQTIEKDSKLVKYLYTNSHSTPFEHTTVTFRIECPIPVSKHVQRHRSFSYNEESARYSKVKQSVYIPTEFRLQDKKNKQSSSDLIHPDSSSFIEQYKDLVDQCYDLYNTMVTSGVSREQARFILPQGMYTSFYMTGNIRNFLHFFGLRESKDSQYEMVQIATAMHELVKPYIPITESCLNTK